MHKACLMCLLKANAVTHCVGSTLAMWPATDPQNFNHPGNNFTAPGCGHLARNIPTGSREANLRSTIFQDESLSPYMERSSSHQTNTSCQPSHFQPLQQRQQIQTHTTQPAAERPSMNLPPLSGDFGASGSSCSIPPHNSANDPARTCNDNSPRVSSEDPSGRSSNPDACCPLAEPETASQACSPPDDMPQITQSRFSTPQAMGGQAASPFPPLTGYSYPQQRLVNAHVGRQDRNPTNQPQQQFQTLPQLPPLSQNKPQQSLKRLAGAGEAEADTGEQTPIILQTSSAARSLLYQRLASAPARLVSKRKQNARE